MFLSRYLLNKINDKFTNLTNEELQNGLNAIGIEVEQIFDNSKLNKGLELVKILDIDKHPDSDHLNICTIQRVDSIVKIVCGAKNLQKNVFAILAPINYELPNGIVIKERKIRGVVSQGMLCGYNELNPYVENFLSKYDQETIIMAGLDEEVNQENFYEYFNLNDVIFELSLPSNRNELNGIYFIAFELNAYFNFQTPLISIENIIVSDSKTKIISEAKELKAYGLLEFYCEPHNFKLDWSFKKYLINSGIHSTNSIVDIGNFITLLFATPTHMFDADKVDDIRIKELNDEIQIQALDNKEYKLNKSTIIVESKNKIVSAIGLIGTKEFAVSENTNHFYMEFANINNSAFIKYAKSNLISSNSKSLFLKSLSTNVNLIAMLIAFNKILPKYSYIKNIKCLKTIDFIPSNSISFDFDEINNILGVNLSKDEIVNILGYTGNKIENNKLYFPYYRQDLINIYDISEEIIKTIDINKFNTTPIVSPVINFNANKLYVFNKKIKDYFVNLGFIETKTYNLTSESLLDRFNLYNIKTNIGILNPISNDRKYLRHNLVDQMINVLVYNMNHKQELENIFEVQKIQFDYKNANHIFNAILCSPIIKNIITKEQVNNNIYTAYNIFESLIKILNLSNIQICNTKLNSNEFESDSFEIKTNNKTIGFIGKINNKFLKKEYKITNNDLFIINLNLDELYLCIDKTINKIKPISEFNPIYKEITFENPNHLNINNILNKLYFDKNIESINLYDYYKNADKDSYTISIKIQSYEKTLDQDEISKLFNQCLSILEKEGLIVRK